MRLDKYMSAAGVLSRKECAAAVKRGRILVGGLPAAKADMQVQPGQSITLDGTPVIYREFTYIMMHKPQGVVSATDDPGERTVLDFHFDQDERWWKKNS